MGVRYDFTVIGHLSNMELQWEPLWSAISQSLPNLIDTVDEVLYLNYKTHISYSFNFDSDKLEKHKKLSTNEILTIYCNSKDSIFQFIVNEHSWELGISLPIRSIFLKETEHKESILKTLWNSLLPFDTICGFAVEESTFDEGDLQKVLNGNVSAIAFDLLITSIPMKTSNEHNVDLLSSGHYLVNRKSP